MLPCNRFLFHSVGGDPLASELAQAIADVPYLAQALLSEHARTPQGRCAVCVAGPQRGQVMHPCRTYAVASAALMETAKRRAS